MLLASEHHKVNKALTVSRRQGRDLADVMADLDILLTDARRDQIQKSSVGQMVRILDAETAHGIGRWFYGDSRPMTAKMMFEAILAWAHHYVEMQS